VLRFFCFSTVVNFHFGPSPLFLSSATKSTFDRPSTISQAQYMSIPFKIFIFIFSRMLLLCLLLITSFLTLNILEDLLAFLQNSIPTFNSSYLVCTPLPKFHSRRLKCLPPLCTISVCFFTEIYIYSIAGNLLFLLLVWLT